MPMPMPVEGDALELLLTAAAERGARNALAAVGLTDAEAGRDIHELRSLLVGWRDARRTVAHAVLRGVTALLLSGLALAAGMLWREHAP